MLKIEWADVEYLCDTLAQEIKECGIEFDFIYGIARGGLTPATLLSHILDIPMVSTLEYLGEQSPYYLIVDDINDSGKTIKALNYHTDMIFKTAVLYERANSQEEADYYGEKIHHNGWIIFPWEQVGNAMHDMSDYLTRRHG